MADSRSHTNPQYSRKEARLNHSKSSSSSLISHILCKSLGFVVFIIAIPLFPSQTPEIFNNTLLNKFWELFHLMFIGLAVCYGLFSRRSSDLEFEGTHLIDDSQSSFVSRIFHVSPIFEDGSEIQCGSVNWNAQIYNEESRSRSGSGVDVGDDEQIKIGGFLDSENRSEILLEQDENNVVQAWSSQYFHGESESVVVVSETNYASEQWGKPQNVGGFRPLGLPVRSLSSRVRNSDSSHQFSNRSLSDSSLMGSSDCPPLEEVEEVKFGNQGPVVSNCHRMEVEEVKFGDQGYVISDEKLNENVLFPSRNRRVSRSVKPELRESVVPQSNRSHFRNSHSSHQFSNGDLSNSSLMGSSNCSPKSVEEEVENLGGQGQPDSDEKLNENVFLPSHSPWLSGPGRPELRERVAPPSNRSHSRNSDGSRQSINESLFDSSSMGSSNCSPVENLGGQGQPNSDEKLNENVFLPSHSPRLSRPGRPQLRERVAPLPNRSHSRNSDGSRQSINGSVFDSSSMGSSNCSPKSVDEEDKNFGDQGPVNVDEKLNENVILPSQNPWLSRPGKPELREGVVPPSNRSHFRPRSVDETQFESFTSQSFGSNVSLSSQTSSVSTSPDLLSPSHSSSSDSPKSGTEQPLKIEEKEATLSPLATDSPKREAPLNAFHLRKYSSGSLFQKNTQKRAKDDSKNPSHKRKEDGQQGSSSKPDKKSTNSVKTSSRGKSVRTIRSGGAYTPEEKKADGSSSKFHMDDNVGKRRDVDVPKKKHIDSNHKVAKKEVLEKVMVESEHESEPEIDDVLVRLAKKAPPPSASNSGHDPNEVDKKASEFIAKFREQIRLQKVASMERSNVVRMSGKYLR